MSVSIHDLRDIHLPTPISAWPPAPGWFLLALLLTISIIVIGSVSHHFWQKRRAKKRALAELATIKASAPSGLEILIEAHKVLRRVALHYYPDDKVAALTGEKWISFLNNKTKKALFTGEISQILISAPYSSETAVNTENTVHAIERWIKQACPG